MAAEKKLADVLRDLPQEFPELNDGMIGTMFCRIVLPQIVTAAKIDERAVRVKLIDVVRRLAHALDLSADDVFASTSR